MDVAIQGEVAGHALGGLRTVLLQPVLHAARCLPHIAPPVWGDGSVDQAPGCSTTGQAQSQGTLVRCTPPALTRPEWYFLRSVPSMEVPRPSAPLPRASYWPSV